MVKMAKVVITIPPTRILRYCFRAAATVAFREKKLLWYGGRAGNEFEEIRRVVDEMGAIATPIF